MKGKINDIKLFFVNFFNKKDSGKKLGFIITFVVFIVLLFFGIWYINFGGNTNSQSDEIADFDQIERVDIKSFEESQNLNKVINTVGLSKPIMIESETFFDQNLNFFYNNQQTDTSYQFVPSNFYVLPNGNEIIINEKNESTYVFNSNSQRFTKIEGGRFSVTPFGGSYFYLANNTNSLSLYSSSDPYLLTSNKAIANISPSTSFQNSEIKIINNSVYVFVYQNSYKTGSVEIWSQRNSQNFGNFEKIITINNVISLNSSDNMVLYTSENIFENKPVYDTSFVTFDNQKTPQTSIIDIKNELNGANVKGNLWAGRCGFLDESIYCPVKEPLARFTDYSFNDVIVEYNTIDRTMKFTFEGIFVSIDKIVFENNKTYIISQKDKNVYEVI